MNRRTAEVAAPSTFNILSFYGSAFPLSLVPIAPASGRTAGIYRFEDGRVTTQERA